MTTDLQYRNLTFIKGIKDGMPICLGYLSISFAFGMTAKQGGLPSWIAILISMSNFTSAGQVAGTDLILTGGTFLEIGITTFVINIRYMLMSLSLSQKLDPKMMTFERMLLAFGNTDEVFAVAMQQKADINAKYLSGLILSPYFGWVMGTVFGATAANLLPDSISSALEIAIYAMFIAIIIPPATKVKPIAIVVLIATIFSTVLKLTPIFAQLSSGWRIIICAIVASTVAAILFPIKEQERGAE